MNKPVTRFGRDPYVPVQSYMHSTVPTFRFEAEIYDCEVVGEVPRELNGSMYRCGGDTAYPTMQGDNLNNGDGVMAAFHFEDGYVDFIQRYVKTERFLLERKNRRRLFGAYRNPYADDPITSGSDRDNTGNTTAFVHHGKLFALREDSIPYELDTVTLETLGVARFGRQPLRSKTMTAHPKIDPVTGEWWSYGQFSQKRLEGEMSLHVIDKDGNVIREEEFTLPYPGMTHDWAVTREHLIFHILPYTVDVARVKAGGDFYAFDVDKPPMFGVMPRSGTTADIRWFEAPGAGVAHFMNAFTQGGTVHVDAPTHDGHFFTFFPETHGRPAEFKPGVFSRFSFDPASGEMGIRPLSNALAGGMPEVDDRFAMLPYRYGFSSSRGGLVRYDVETGGRQEHTIEGSAQEPVFVPRTPDAPEGDGFLLAVVTRPDNRADLLILDAMDIEAEPLATVRLPFSQPWLFHGCWRDAPAARLPR